MTREEIIEKFESDKAKSSLDIAGGVFVETDLVHEIVKALRSKLCEDATPKDIFCMRCEYKEQEPILDKIRAEIHATAEMHEDGNYYLRDEWIDEIFDNYKAESEEHG